MVPEAARDVLVACAQLAVTRGITELPASIEDQTAAAMLELTAAWSLSEAPSRIPATSASRSARPPASSRSSLTAAASSSPVSSRHPGVMPGGAGELRNEDAITIRARAAVSHGSSIADLCGKLLVNCDGGALTLAFSLTGAPAAAPGLPALAAPG